MNKGNDASALRRRRGVSDMEMLIAIAVLAVCAELIFGAAAFGLQYLQKRIRYSQAVILLDTLCAVVRNDLEYATKCYADGSIERVIRDYDPGKADEPDGNDAPKPYADYDAKTWYGVGQWRTGNPDSHFDETLIQWRGIGDSAARPGQIIRKSALSDGQYFFDCACPPESYESADGHRLYAAMKITPGFVAAGEKVDRFSVTLTLYDAPDETAQVVAQRRDFAVLLVQPIPVIEK